MGTRSAAKPGVGARRTSAALAFTGRSFTFSVLRIFSSELTALNDALRTHLAKGADFFQNAAVVLDLNEVEAPERLNLRALLQGLRTHGLRPAALLAGAPAPLAAAARELGLGVVGAGAAREAAPAPPAYAPAKLVTQPVRSGQQVYAPGGDLVVVGPVNTGAELLADGSIHVYGTFRGRALAGVQGDESARIFCQDFAGELVSIAGVYRVVEEGTRPPRSVQVRLVQGQLVIEAL
ncbi:septum site-determining protein MinC [Ectothiorhodospiraceae bacterium 2226]|nr:septum site-determining protein MinC [Ectothiorhodospiraceae bacterium 2226]